MKEINEIITQDSRQIAEALSPDFRSVGGDLETKINFTNTSPLSYEEKRPQTAVFSFLLTAKEVKLVIRNLNY